MTWNLDLVFNFFYIFDNSIFILHNLKIFFYFYFYEFLFSLKSIFIPIYYFSFNFYYFNILLNTILNLLNLIIFLILKYLLLNYIIIFIILSGIYIFFYIFFIFFIILFYYILKISLFSYFLNIFFWFSFYSFIDLNYIYSYLNYIYDYFFFYLNYIYNLLLFDGNFFYILFKDLLFFYLLFLYNFNKKIISHNKFIFDFKFFLKIIPFSYYNLLLSNKFIFKNFIDNNKLFWDLFYNESKINNIKLYFYYHNFVSYHPFWNNRLLSYDPLFQNINFDHIGRNNFNLSQKNQLDLMINFPVTPFSPNIDWIDKQIFLNWSIIYNSNYKIIFNSLNNIFYNYLQSFNSIDILSNRTGFSFDGESQNDLYYYLFYLTIYKNLYLIDNNFNKINNKFLFGHYQELFSLNKFINIKNDNINYFSKSIIIDSFFSIFNIIFLNIFLLFIIIFFYYIYLFNFDLFIFDFFILNLFDLFINIYDFIFIPLFNISLLNNLFPTFKLKMSRLIKTLKVYTVFINFDTLNLFSFDYFSTIFFGLKNYSFLNYFNIINNYCYFLFYFSCNNKLILILFIFFIFIVRFMKIKIFILFYNFIFNSNFYIFNKYKRRIKSILFNY